MGVKRGYHEVMNFLYFGDLYEPQPHTDARVAMG
jgi:hypothetical protein